MNLEINEQYQSKAPRYFKNSISVNVRKLEQNCEYQRERAIISVLKNEIRVS